MLRRPWCRVVLLTLAIVFVMHDEAAARFRWHSSLLGCEPPAVFYSSAHRPGARPCCPLADGMCDGGTACPATGLCPGTGLACTPPRATPRPNIVVMISDDHGSCQYGSAVECRSAVRGQAIPAPVTPNLDLLAGYGTVFTTAHNTSPWCFPSLFSIVTGRFQRSFNGVTRPAEQLGAIPRALRSLTGDPSAVTDPYDARSSVGGYCSFLGGKLTGRLGDPGFHAEARTSERAIGRTSCVAGAPGEAPRCGADALPVYDPSRIYRGSDLFEFLDTLAYPLPGAPGAFGMQTFFAWYAPRIPHQPLRAPALIRHYLFGAGAAYPLGGLFDLGAFCSGASCPAGVTAFDDAVFGDTRELYANLWWMDDGLREIRKYLAAKSAPHCIGADGTSRFAAGSAGACAGTWVDTMAPAPDRNTVIMFLADNGWHLPRSKHRFTENGMRTRLIVFDPRTLPEIPPWSPTEATIPPPRESLALAHAVDVLPTAVGFALGTPGAEPCPEAPDGSSRCDGRDLRPHLASAPGGPAPTATLRRALCGHMTQKASIPTRDRYLLTRAGSVGRCSDRAAPTCASDAQCGPTGFCLAGRCASQGESPCTATSGCLDGAVCFGGHCRVAPSCLDDSDCAALFPGRSAMACVAKDKKWCRNDPSVACGAHDDCPACAPGEPACSRLCEPRQLKFYVNLSAANTQMTDLFLDPDETGLHGGPPGSLVRELSRAGGPYAGAIRRANCCIDAWWPEAAEPGTTCTPSDICPLDLSCVE